MTHEPITESIVDLRETLPPAPPLTKAGWRGRTLLGVLISLVILTGAVGWLFLVQEKQSANQGNRGAPVAIVAATIEKGAIPITFDALGTVVPIATTLVRTQIAGQLTEIAFHEGERVQKGDFLAQIDPRPYEFTLAQSQGQLRHDQALLRTAENDLTRYRKLVAQDSIAKQQADNQEQLVEQYRGTIATDQALVDQAALNLAYCHIVAPVSGRVGLRQVDLGNYLQVTDSNGIVIITQLQPITVIFTLAQDKLPMVVRRLRSGTKLPVSVFDPDHTAELARGTLIAIDNQIDPGTGTIKLRAEFANEDETLFPNQFVNAQLLVEILPDAVLAPVAAIQHGAPGAFVYLVKPDNTVSLRVVKLGASSGQVVAVTEGLAAGDHVVVDGADKLREGSRVVQPAAIRPSGAPNPVQTKAGG